MQTKLPAELADQKDLLEVIDFVFVTREKGIQAKADGGGVNWLDAPKLLDLIGPGSAAIEGAEHIVPNLESASPAVREALIDYVSETHKLDVSRPIVWRRIIKAAKVGASLYALFTDDDADDNTANADTQTL